MLIPIILNILFFNHDEDTFHFQKIHASFCQIAQFFSVSDSAEIFSSTELQTFESSLGIHLEKQLITSQQKFDFYHQLANKYHDIGNYQKELQSCLKLLPFSQTIE